MALISSLITPKRYLPFALGASASSHGPSCESSTKTPAPDLKMGSKGPALLLDGAVHCEAAL
jgi:hypothetical protein